MRILLTNDDGYDSPGLQLLKAALAGEHEVWVIAPEQNRSGSSHSITLKAPTRVLRRGERDLACSGTPVDCVILGFLGLVTGEIDLVIAGINLGPNLGTDIIYSGTAAAARQGALMGKPSLAASLASFLPPFHLEYPARFIARNARLFHDLWTDDHFLNINFPAACAPDCPSRITIPTRRIYRDKLVQFQAPDESLYCFLGGELPHSQMEEGSDYRTVEEGAISLSPVILHPSNHDVAARYGEVEFQR